MDRICRRINIERIGLATVSKEIEKSRSIPHDLLLNQGLLCLEKQCLERRENLELIIRIVFILPEDC